MDLRTKKDRDHFDKKVLYFDFLVSGLTEMLGTMIFVFFSTGSAVARSQSYLFEDSADVTRISLTFGFSLAAVIYATANISGGNINPAVTFSFVVTKNMTVVRGVIYVICQLIGAIIGSALVYGSVPEGMHGDLGATVPNPAMTDGEVFLTEFVLTFALVYVVHHVANLKRDTAQFGQNMGKHGALAIGFIVLAGHLFAVPLTGPSMNPARTFGPAVVANQWTKQWIYWLAQLIAGPLAGIYYLFANIKLGQKGEIYERRQAPMSPSDLPTGERDDDDDMPIG